MDKQVNEGDINADDTFDFCEIFNKNMKRSSK